MSPWFDNILVGLALLASVGYAFAALGPRALKQRLLAGLVDRLAGTSQFFGLLKIARRLQAKAAAKSAGACGGCDNCGSGSNTAAAVHGAAQGAAQGAARGTQGFSQGANQGATQSAAGTTQSAVGDVRIPVAKIGRRGSGPIGGR
jgi:hypothetical protein